MKPLTIISIAAALFAVAFIVSKLGNYYIVSSTPDVIMSVENTAESDSSISTIIGGYENFASTYNEHDLAKDTLPFSVKIFGGKGSIQLKGMAKKMNNEHWSIIKIDTTYIPN